MLSGDQIFAIVEAVYTIVNMNMMFRRLRQSSASPHLIVLCVCVCVLVCMLCGKDPAEAYDRFTDQSLEEIADDFEVAEEELLLLKGGGG